MPIALGSDQTWALTGGGSTSQPFALSLQPYFNDPSSNGTGDLTGNHALNVDLARDGRLNIFGDADVGPVSVTGADSSQTGGQAYNNGLLYFTNGLNAMHRNPLTVTDVSLATSPPGPSSNPGVTNFGPVTAHRGKPGVRGLAALPRARPTSVAAWSSTRPPRRRCASMARGPRPRRILPVTSTDTSLAGSLELGFGYQLGSCPTFPVGQSDTLIATSGALSGTFSNVANGGDLQLGESCSGQFVTQQVRIDSPPTASRRRSWTGRRRPCRPTQPRS